MTSSSPSLFVVRGGSRNGRSHHACTAHDTQPGRYLLLEVDGGKVNKRTLVPASDRAAVEATMSNYRGAVYVDKREDTGLLPLTAPQHARKADLAQMRRAKSDEEMDALRGISLQTRDMLSKENLSASTFEAPPNARGSSPPLR